MLEETHKWFLENVTNDPTTEAYQSWMNVYNFYDSIRGKNFNSGKQYREDYPHMEFDERTKSSVYITELMEKYNTNIFYYNRDLTKSSCYATMSIGGIHGAEIHQRRYKYDCDLVEIHNRKVQQIKDMTENGTVKEALNDLPTKVTLPSGEEVKVRDFIKNPKRIQTNHTVSGNLKKNLNCSLLRNVKILILKSGSLPKNTNTYQQVWLTTKTSHHTTHFFFQCYQHLKTSREGWMKTENTLTSTTNFSKLV